jgi:arginine exporter protein ArgO
MRNKRLMRCLACIGMQVVAIALVVLGIAALREHMPALSSILVTSALLLWVKGLRGVTHGW